MTGRSWIEGSLGSPANPHLVGSPERQHTHVSLIRSDETRKSRELSKKERVEKEKLRGKAGGTADERWGDRRYRNPQSPEEKRLGWSRVKAAVGERPEGKSHSLLSLGFSLSTISRTTHLHIKWRDIWGWLLCSWFSLSWFHLMQLQLSHTKSAKFQWW